MTPCALIVSFVLAMFSDDAGMQFQYVHPLPGSSLVSKQTTVIVRPGDKVLSSEQELASLFSVSGSVSGTHTGRVIISDDQNTIIWKPAVDFAPSETVFVKIQEGIKTTAQGSHAELSYYFLISPNINDLPITTEYFPNLARSKAERLTQSVSRIDVPNGGKVSLPSDFPAVKINKSIHPDSGYLFLSNMWNGNPYLLIFDNAGNPIFYRKAPGNAYDFKVQPNGQLSYYIQSGINRYYILDSTYTMVDSIVSVQGYTPNEHELRILPNGHFLLIAMDVQTIDMSKIVAGGNPRASVLGNHILELDAAKNVVFVWRCWDHFKIIDGIDAVLTDAFFDYVHMNAIDIDKDSNLVISCRNMSEITKIERTTGRIMWRLGGKNNQFTFANDPSTFTYLNKPLSFSYQHDVRVTSAGNYTLFDNGNLRPNLFSRAVEYKIDTLSKSADMVWQYRNTPDFYSAWMGSVQRLPSGATLINWADAYAPKATEVDPNGTKLFELDFVTPASNYRVNRSIWKGKASAPYLVVEPHQDRTTLFFNSFGDTNVVQYNVYGGLSPRPAVLLAATGNTTMEFTGLENGRQYYFRVTSVDGKGHESTSSNEESLLVKYVMPGDNLLLNGDFSQGVSQWQLGNYDGGASQSSVTQKGECLLAITKGGPNVWSVQFLQANLEVVYGKKYVFEFDASASAKRTIDIKVEMNAPPYTNYSRTGFAGLDTVKKHFSFPFTMQDPTDYRARVSFNCGISNASVFFDNISLHETVPLAVDDPFAAAPRQTILEDNYPNPFNPSTTLSYGLRHNSTVSLKVYNVLGQQVANLVQGEQSAGWQRVTWNANVSTGLYFYRLEAVDSNNPNNRFVQVKKMLLLK